MPESDKYLPSERLVVDRSKVDRKIVGTRVRSCDVISILICANLVSLLFKGVVSGIGRDRDT
jgi:hypothetical protein